MSKRYVESISVSFGFFVVANFFPNYIWLFSAVLFARLAIITVRPSRKIKSTFDKSKYKRHNKNDCTLPEEIFGLIQEGTSEVAKMIGKRILYNLIGLFTIISILTFSYLILVGTPTLLHSYFSIPPLLLLMFFLNSWFAKLYPNLYYTKGLNYPFNKGVKFLHDCYSKQINFGLFLRDFSTERIASTDSIFNRKFDNGPVVRAFGKNDSGRLRDDPFYNLSQYIPLFGLCNKRDLNPPTFVVPICSKDKDWELIAKKMIMDAELIIIACNKTSWGLRKELKLIIEQNCQHKTLVITDELYFIERYLEPYQLPYITTLDTFLNNVHSLHMMSHMNKGQPLKLTASFFTKKSNSHSFFRFGRPVGVQWYIRPFFRIMSIFSKADDY